LEDLEEEVLVVVDREANGKKQVMKYTLHPWHGVEIGENAPEECVAYIEIVPTDTIKYEVDKKSGLLKIDRPQLFSNVFPALYGFFPQTFCDKKVAEYCMEKSGLNGIIGDQDPLDVCILTSKDIARGGILVNAIPIGGFRMIDKDEADDKIICVLKGDDVYEGWNDINDIPAALINKLKHYFLTYKNLPDDINKKVQIAATYNSAEAIEVIRRSMEDYNANYSDK
jgi:inorganic pyrophosphatase